MLRKNGQYKMFCSTKCQSSSTLEKRAKTNIEKYGTANPMQSKLVLATRDANNLEKYGVTNPFSLKEIQEKQQSTCEQRYGTKFASQSIEIQEKIKHAWAKYPNGIPWSDPAIREKRTATLLERYGVAHPIQHPSIKDKIKKTCLELYGAENASQSAEIAKKISTANNSASVIAQRKRTMVDRYGVEFYTQKGIENQLATLSNAQWLQDKVTELGQVGVAQALGVSIDTVRKYVREHNIVLPNAGSSFERQVLSFIQENYIGEIVGNTRQLIGKEIDIYLPTLNLAFECNGTYWHSELNGRTRSYHLDKTNKCKDAGVHLVHIWEHDWNLNSDLIKSRIASLLGANQTIYARKCNIIKLTQSTAASFLNESHIQGNCASLVQLGLQTKDGVLVAVMTFGKSRFSKVAEFELIRFCNALGTSVVGGANKLFSYFLKNYNPKGVISYSDKSFNTGRLYETLGFDYSHSSAPAYAYTTDYKTLENRIKFQKHKLEKHLAKYDPALSEWDNMQLNGYDRIWDCGTDVWVYSTQLYEQA